MSHRNPGALCRGICEFFSQRRDYILGNNVANKRVLLSAFKEIACQKTNPSYRPASRAHIAGNYKAKMDIVR